MKCTKTAIEGEYPDGVIGSAFFRPVTGGSPENDQFFKYTPGGTVELSILNPDIKFDVGTDYYFDITPADPPAEETIS
jgi:hypothetical protein